MQRTECASCASTDLHHFLDLGESPLADAFVTDPLAPCVFYPLKLLVCLRCYLVQLEEVVPDELLFNAEYTFYSSTSAPLVEHHRRYAQDLMDWGIFDPTELTVEIACNDGSLLHLLHEAGGRCLGVDPAIGPLVAGQQRWGYRAIGEAFNFRLAENLRADYGQAGLVIANNVLAHVADPGDFINGVARLLKPTGRAVFEVQYFADLFAGNMLDHVYHEHRFFYTIRSLAGLLRQNGLYVTGMKKQSTQGGSLRIYASRNPREAMEMPFSYHSEQHLLKQSTYDSFQDRVNYWKNSLLQTLFSFPGKRVAGFGATAKSTTLLNFTGIGTSLLEYIVDTTPAKVGKFSPGTRIPIISPEEEANRGYPDAYLLLAWNYLGDILRRSDLTSPKSSKWIVPIPHPVII